MKESQRQSMLMSKLSWALPEQSDQPFGILGRSDANCRFLQLQNHLVLTISPPCCPKIGISLERYFEIVISHCWICFFLGCTVHGMWHLLLLWCSGDVSTLDGMDSFLILPFP